MRQTAGAATADRTPSVLFYSLRLLRFLMHGLVVIRQKISVPSIHDLLVKFNHRVS